ncbi:MAG: hypothetical protein QW186_07465, partial [Candidatus Bathyarchaeia archaeon]
MVALASNFMRRRAAASERHSCSVPHSKLKGGKDHLHPISWWTGGDLNPRPPECKSFLSAFRWEEFEKWLLSDKKPKTAREILNYARRYFPALESGNLSEIIVLPPAKRRVVLASLSNLAKFLGVYDYWRGLVHKYGVKWTPK